MVLKSRRDGMIIEKRNENKRKPRRGDREISHTIQTSISHQTRFQIFLENPGTLP